MKKPSFFYLVLFLVNQAFTLLLYFFQEIETELFIILTILNIGMITFHFINKTKNLRRNYCKLGKAGKSIFHVFVLKKFFYFSDFSEASKNSLFITAILSKEIPLGH